MAERIVNVLEVVDVHHEKDSLVGILVIKNSLDLTCQRALIHQTRQLVRVLLDIDLPRQNELLDPDGIGDDVEHDSNDREDNNVDEIHLPDLKRLYVIHPDQEHRGRCDQLEGHEERLVYHEYRRDQDQRDKRRRRYLRLVLRDQARENEQQRDRQVNHQLRNQRILLHDKKENARDHRISQCDKIEDLIRFQKIVHERT